MAPSVDVARPGVSDPVTSNSPRWRWLLLVPVIAYGIVLTAMAAVASRCNRWVAGGGALFVVSDSILAINTFVPDARIPLVDFLIMVTYLAAQTLIVWGLLRHERDRVATAPMVAQAG